MHECMLTAIRAIGCSLVLTWLASTPALAQAVPPETTQRPAVIPLSPEAQARIAAFEARIRELARTLADAPMLRGLSLEERQARIDFVFGNMLFVAAHELGHAVISEFRLPVLGREEDAADDFAILKALVVVHTDFSHRVLVLASKGWFLAAKRERRDGEAQSYYGRHGLNEQRAYQIVCLMVGSDPEKFRALADEKKLPEDRRRSCVWDYETAVQSWATVMGPHLRKTDRPVTPVEVVYGDAQGELAAFADMFKSIGFLEAFAEYAGDRYALPAPITMEMRTCGEPGARWTIPTRRLHICYEMIQEFVELHRDYAKEQSFARRKQPRASRVASPRRSGDNARSFRSR